MVEIRHVNLAIKEMFNSTHIQLMRGLARADKLFLGMLLLVVRTGPRGAQQELAGHQTFQAS